MFHNPRAAKRISWSLLWKSRRCSHEANRLGKLMRCELWAGKAIIWNQFMIHFFWYFSTQVFVVGWWHRDGGWKNIFKISSRNNIFFMIFSVMAVCQSPALTTITLFFRVKIYLNSSLKEFFSGLCEDISIFHHTLPLHIRILTTQQLNHVIFFQSRSQASDCPCCNGVSDLCSPWT